MWVAKNGARVGAAAFVLGLSLAGPVAVAAADSTDAGPSAVSGSAGPASAKSSATRINRAGATPAQPQQTRAPRSASAATAPSRTAARTASTPTQSRRANATATAATVATPINDPVVDLGTQSPVPATPAASADPETTAAPAISAPTPVAAKSVAAVSIAGAAATASLTDPFSGLFAPIQAFVDGIGLLVRRTFFNQAPTVAPVQLTGQTGGPNTPITGTVGAVDPEGDTIVYTVTDLPVHGTVVVAPDGTYTYTPGTGFTGRDSFMVDATDTGFHINLLDLFRPASTAAFLGVSQNVPPSLLTFTFTYDKSWTQNQAARGALEWTAQDLATYFVVTRPVNITFDVTGQTSPLSGTLAQSGSDLTSSDQGFFNTVVQEKILTGVDANGAQADGTIDWNFGQPWAFGNRVTYSQYDFTSTALHEMLHAFGFLSNVDQAGWDATNRNWLTFDKYMVTSDGTNVISSGFRWNPTYDTNLTGGNGGLYFGGPTAVSVYGRPVPLYTPNPWEAGSSVSHLDDSTFTGSNSQLMNAISDKGLGIRVISPVELAILQDIGYTVNYNPVSAAVLIVGFGFIRRPRRR